MRMRIAIAGAVIGTTAGDRLSRRAVRTWRTLGRRPGRGGKALPGDDLVAGADRHRDARRSRSLRPRGRLAVARQMGFGRGGWYSYDQLDMSGRSAVEDPARVAGARRWVTSCPTSPAAGSWFDVRRAAPRPSSLYLDTALIEPGRSCHGGDAVASAARAGSLAASGAFLGQSPRVRGQLGVRRSSRSTADGPA